MTNPIPGADSLLADQVSAWRKEVARLNDLIAHAVGEPDAAANVGANVAAAKMLSGALNRARDTLRYYAEQEHFVRHQPDEWETVSGEPESLYEDSHNTATIEDGTLAKNTLNDIAGVEAYASIAAGAPAETPKPDDWITAKVARHLDLAYRNGVSAGWNAGILGDEDALKLLRSRVGKKSEYEELFAAHPAPIAGDVEKDARDATRWRFMMRVADNPDGPEMRAMESLGNEALESSRPESEQLGELVDRAAMLANSSSGEAG